MASSAGRTAGGVLRWLVVLGLVAALLWLVSERNARIWVLAPDDGRLVVKRGLFLPLGSAALKPADAAQAKAYGPLVPPPGKPLPESRDFFEEAELDQALYKLLDGWAHEDVGSGDPARLERGLGYLERAMELPAISTAQRDDLAALRAESGYFEAKRLIERAGAELNEALQKLNDASSPRSPRVNEAKALLRELAPALEATTSAIRAAGANARPASVTLPPKDAKDAANGPGDAAKAPTDAPKDGQAQK